MDDSWMMDVCFWLQERDFPLPLLSSEAYSGQQEGFRRPLPVGLLLRINYQMMGKLYSGVVRQTTVLRHLGFAPVLSYTWTLLAISHGIAAFQLAIQISLDIPASPAVSKSFHSCWCHISEVDNHPPIFEGFLSGGTPKSFIFS